MKSRLLILSLAIFALSSFRANAQVDVTVNPLGLLFGGINVGADFILSDEFSIEGTVGYNSRDAGFGTSRYTGIPIQAVGKYYFNPDNGADKFYASLFIRYVNRSYTYDDNSGFANFSQSRIGAGLGIGTKVVSRKNIVFDFGVQVGRVLADNTTYEDSTGSRETLDIGGLILGLKLGVGYRFGGS